MTNGKAVIGALVVGAGAWFVYKRFLETPAYAQRVDGGSNFFGPTNAYGSAPSQGGGSGAYYGGGATAGNAPARPAAPNSAPTFPTGAVTTSVGGGLIAAAGPATLTTGLLTAGIGAGAALVTWGIVDKGWFRGGEEGVKVNPARDGYLSTFAIYDYMRDSSNPPGFYGLSNVLAIMGRHELFDELTKADTMAEFNDVVARINTVLATASQEQVAAARAASKY